MCNHKGRDSNVVVLMFGFNYASKARNISALWKSFKGKSKSHTYKKTIYSCRMHFLGVQHCLKSFN